MAGIAQLPPPDPDSALSFDEAEGWQTPRFRSLAIKNVSAATENARRLLGNPISVRLADGWYPSGRDAEGNVVHDRHVLIWVRAYEGTIKQLLNELEG